MHTLQLTYPKVYVFFIRLTLSESKTVDFNNRNFAHDTELWDGDHHVLLLSGYSRNLETNTKMFSLSFKYLIYFIKKVLGIKTKGVLMY